MIMKSARPRTGAFVSEVVCISCAGQPIKKSNANSQQEREKCQPRKGTAEKVNPIIGEPPEIFRFLRSKSMNK